jgi:hypothetical protein
MQGRRCVAAAALALLGGAARRMSPAASGQGSFTTRALGSPLPVGEGLGWGPRYHPNVNEASSGWKTSVLVPSKLATGLAHSML